MPPVAAQAPLLRPLETEIPLPPSISGHTSRPERINGLREITRSLLMRARSQAWGDVDLFRQSLHAAAA